MRKNKSVDDAKRLQIIEEYLNGASKYSLVKKYNIAEGIGSINRWLRIFGVEERTNSVSEQLMKKKEENREPADISSLKLENSLLKARLAKAEMAAKAYSTMIDLAEETYNIEVRKNFATKRSASCTKKKK